MTRASAADQTPRGHGGREARAFWTVVRWALASALVLSLFSLMQKVILGLPLERVLHPIGFIVPVAFGALTGALLGVYQNRLRASTRAATRNLGQLRAIMDTVSAGILLLDMDTREILEVNPFALELVGRRREELVGATCSGILDPREPRACPFTDLVLAPEGSERVLVSSEGERIPVLVTARVMVHDGRKVLLASFLDLRERSALERQLQQAQRLEILGKTTAGVAHDFNNILSALQSSLELIALLARETEPIRRQAATALLACQRGARLLRGLRALGRNTPLEPEPMDLNPMVLETRDLLRHLLPPEIRVDLELWTAPLEVWGDAGQLGQVLLNLAVNARDAMPEGGSLLIRTSLLEAPEGAGAAQVLLEVRDTGCGIPPGHLPHIFEAFFTTKTPDRGSGLGLSIVKGIVEQHAGTIQVRSDPGQGSCFRILLPRHVSVAASA